jgi:hypothetical protein
MTPHPPLAAFGRAGAGCDPVFVPAGHIHDTWLAGDLVVQRLNGRVFPDPVAVVEGVVRITHHLHQRLEAEGWAAGERARRALTPVAAAGGGYAHVDGAGDVWRAFVRIRGATAPLVVGGPAQARAVGLALGRFLAHVGDLPGPPPAPAIPGFKDFGARRRAFEDVVAADPLGRAGGAAAEIGGVRRHHGLVDRLEAATAAGDLPPRLVHNDAKASNVLLDDGSGDGLCVIDLDTVAPGTVLFDAGDLLRSTAVAAPEDAGGGTGAGGARPFRPVRPEVAAAALEGWLAGAGDLVTAGERALLPLAGPLMAYEAALRFLADHLGGDRYFRIEGPGHNLRRCRAQLAVLAALAAAAPLVAGVADP